MTTQRQHPNRGSLTQVQAAEQDGVSTRTIIRRTAIPRHVYLKQLAERRATAVLMRRGGATYAQIGEALGTTAEGARFTVRYANKLAQE